MSSGRLQPAAGGIISLQQGDTSQLEDCDALWQSQLQWESDSCGIRRHTPSCLMLMTYRYRRWVCVRRLISLEEPKNNSVNPSASSVSRRLYFSLLMYIFVWAATHTQLLCRMCGSFKTAVKCAGVTPGTCWSVNADVLTEEFCSDVTERARGLPPFISSYISVSWISCSAFNYQLLAAFSAFFSNKLTTYLIKYGGEKLQVSEYWWGSCETIWLLWCRHASLCLCAKFFQRLFSFSVGIKCFVVAVRRFLCSRVGKLPVIHTSGKMDFSLF